MERMKKEEVEGPPKDLFKKGRDSDDILVQEDDGNDYDEDALRKYQLDRLRYAIHGICIMNTHSLHVQILLRNCNM